MKQNTAFMRLFWIAATRHRDGLTIALLLWSYSLPQARQELCKPSIWLDGAWKIILLKVPSMAAHSPLSSLWNGSKATQAHINISTHHALILPWWIYINWSILSKSRTHRAFICSEMNHPPDALCGDKYIGRYEKDWRHLEQQMVLPNARRRTGKTYRQLNSP